MLFTQVSGSEQFCTRAEVLSVVGFVRRRAAGLQHLLHQVESNPSLALVLGDGEVVEEVEMTHVGAVRVSVLVHQPFPLGGVGVTGADVLGLQMFQLTVDVVAVGHVCSRFRWVEEWKH